MQHRLQHLILAFFLLLTINAAATVFYVDVNTTNPAPPYTNWSTAARDIQSAVDASVAGDTVLVTNGTYATGGRALSGIMTNRVAIDRAITVQSINGPGVTVIQGYKLPVVLLGDGVIRCAYLTNGAVLSGFTLTNGATRLAGAPFSERNGGGASCESASAVISNCVVQGNSALYYGGGVYRGTMNNCVVAGNSTETKYWSIHDAGRGGGAYSSVMNNCTVTNNSAKFFGGGVFGGTLNNCTLSGNSAPNGGGTQEAEVNNCTLTGNSASYGGGAGTSTLNNCSVVGNSASVEGGGAYACNLNNCTLTGNLASLAGGGAYGCNLNNCIAYFNDAGLLQTNYSGGSLNYCCTTPQPPGGVGNISLDPQLASASHLSAASPCRGMGSARYASGTDMDGEFWASPPLHRLR